MMKKFINAADAVARETLEGYLAVHGQELDQVGDLLAIARREPLDKVAIVSGGGSGHEPMWLEYAGAGFADAVVEGDVFAAPPPPAIVAAARAVDRGHGILFVYGNYTGDSLNFDLAAEELEEAGHQVRTVRVTDDLASASREERHLRRGIAGGFFTSKIAGAASERGLNLDEVHRLAAAANEATSSIGVASAGGTIPGKDEATFELPLGLLEIGMGMHGEPGVRRGPMLPADDLVDQMWDLLVTDLELLPDQPIAVLVNSLGATTRAELYIVARRLRSLIDAARLPVLDFQVGSFATCQEMHGFSISAMRCTPELAELYAAPGQLSFYSTTS